MCLLCGYATSWTFILGRHETIQGVYPATKFDTEAIRGLPTVWNEKDYLNAIITTPVIILDYPFSLVFDTLLLPYDLFTLRR